VARQTETSRVASAIRDAIVSGEYPPGSRLPHGRDLGERYSAGRGAIYGALRQLAAEGLVSPVRRGGTTVREVGEARVIERDRGVLEDERGYYFDAAAKHWNATRPAVITWAAPPADVARLLGLGPGEQALSRARAVGPPGGRPVQLSTSYIPRDIAEAAEITGAITGPTGIYGRFEQLEGAPLAWRELVGARMPSPVERAELVMPLGVPVLRLLRVTSSGTPGRRVLEVAEYIMSAAAFTIGYRLRRSRRVAPAAATIAPLSMRQGESHGPPAETERPSHE
jgi:GntR family transcriptional regulator